MNKLLEYCKSNGYSLSLTNFLVDLFDKYSTNTSIDEQENFLNALINTKIVLVGSIEEFIITIKNKLYDEIGYEMSSGEELAMTYMYRQKGIYLPIPNIKSNSISRTIVVRVNKTGELICDEDNISLSHEIFHLLRSYGDSEIINSSSEVTLKSGVIVTKIPIIDGFLDYLNGTKQNVQCEENFVGFLGEKYNLISQMKTTGKLDNKDNFDFILGNSKSYSYKLSPRLESEVTKYKIMDSLDRILEKGTYSKASELGENPKGTIRKVVEEYERGKEKVLTILDSRYNRQSDDT